MMPFVRLWLWISAFASLAGWALSAAGELNRAGYAVAFVAFVLFLIIFRKAWGSGRAMLRCGPVNGFIVFAVPCRFVLLRCRL